ncbi:MAG: hypothetical protein FGM40_02490 [Rhodocyclaceae bacterium]|nr:hypothetical protein [Rhodocyclaceae bacterium]
MAMASVVGLCFVVTPASAAATGVSFDPATESGSPLSSAERELFRQDVEHLQQNFYQASPESRRRWIESVRERRQQLDQQEDQAALAQSRIGTSRAGAAEGARAGGGRPALRERPVD